MLFNIFEHKNNEVMYTDVRQLPGNQQYFAHLVVDGGAYKTTAGKGQISSTHAIEILGLTLDDAATFENLHGKVNGLVFDNDTGHWVERSQWQRRVR